MINKLLKLLGIRPKLKLYAVERSYGNNVMIDICWAYDVDGVYKAMRWNRGDKPPLQIRELTKRIGCVFWRCYNKNLTSGERGVN